MRQMIQRAIIEQLLGITILPKSRTVKRTDPSKLKMLTRRKCKNRAIQSSKRKIQGTIEGLERTQRAWIAKKSQDIEKLSNPMTN